MTSSILLLGTSHRIAPVEERERFSVAEGAESELLHALLRLPGVEEAAVLSTCNRFELYLGARDDGAVVQQVLAFLAEQARVPAAWFERFFYVRRDNEAIQHLFRVAGSLDSLVLGEPQIMGQVKRAYAASQNAGGTGPVLNRLFHQALHVGKRVRTETAIAENAVSVSYAGVELARKVFDDLKGKSVLVLGAGKMGALSVQHLRAAGADRIHIVNRSPEKAQELALRMSGTAHGLDELDELLTRVDIVISSTGSQHYVVRYDAVKAAVARRKYRPLFLIDIAVPRDIDPRCDSLQNVYLFDVDDLQQVVESNRANRRTEAVKAEDIARRETDLMLAWIAEAQVVPTIVSLREKLTRLKDEELDRLRRANPDLPPEAIKAMERFAHSLINKVLHEPTATLRRSSASDHHQMLVAAVRSLFDLSEAPSERTPTTTGAAGRS